MNYHRFLFFSVAKRRQCIIAALMILFTYLFVPDMAYANSQNTQVDITSVDATELGLTCKSCVLMEASTGTIVYEKEKDERLSPASITKIMTLLLIFEAIESGQISMDEEVTTSSYAKSMGGSQVFLEEGEKQTVETLIKCIVVASGNDASVAMAEHIAGSETEFVARMNKKAEELGMNNTHFEDCCGLTDSDNHFTSAYDVSLMSRELIVKHSEILQYSSIWMENITHVTKKGSSEFGLANTNKLLKMYPYTTGLKTGSTSKAKYCVSATAKKDDIELIAVVMAAKDHKIRFAEAETLLKYGYGVCRLYKDKENIKTKSQPVKGGVKENVKCAKEGEFSYLSTDGTDIDKIEKNEVYNKEITAPVKKGTVIGKVVYTLNGSDIGSINIVAVEKVEKAGFGFAIKQILKKLML